MKAGVLVALKRGGLTIQLLGWIVFFGNVSYAVTLTLGARNLLDENYFDTSRHFYECFAGDPRTFEIGLRGKF